MYLCRQFADRIIQDSASKMKIKTPKVPKYLKSVKYVLGFTNCLFLLTGVLLIITGAVELKLLTEYNLFVTNRFYSLPEFMIATGIIILLAVVLGFYGALSEEFYYIAGYLCLCVVVLVFELSLTIAGYGLKNNVNSELRAPMAASMNLYNSRSEHTKAWDDIQQSFECCGVGSRTDWPSYSMPVSCCHVDYGTISPFPCSTGNAYNVGCITSLGEWLQYNAFIVGVTALVVTCIQIVITSVSGWMAWKAKFEVIELES